LFFVLPLFVFFFLVLFLYSLGFLSFLSLSSFLNPPSLCFSGCFYRAKSEFFKISSLSPRIVILYRDIYCFRFALYLVE
jgi:hypothetical protein